MPKVHLISSDDPLVERCTYWAVCGAKVEHSIFQFFFTEDARSFLEGLNKINTCANCVAARNFLNGYYVYGLVAAKCTPESDRAAELAVA
jgi:hypothetical protein